MAYDANCIPPTSTFDEDATVLGALVAANPADYQLEDRGLCDCCAGACSVCGVTIVRVQIQVTATGCMHTYFPDDVLLWSPASGQLAYEKDYDPLNVNNVIITFNCDANGFVVTGRTTSDTIPCGGVRLSVGGSGLKPVTVGAPVCNVAGFVSQSFTIDFAAAGTVTFLITQDTTVNNPWWRVETGAYPYCDCQQGVTEAVGGPYTTQAACQATCTGIVEWCCGYQDYDNLGNMKGAPYTGCITGNYIIGQLTTEAGGSGSYRTRLVKDGPFLNGCDCGPCQPQAKDSNDAGCGTVYYMVSGGMAPGASSSPSMIGMSPMPDWAP